MSAFLYRHVHWLWACLHWIHHDIYAPWTLGVFVFIGAAQTLIAWESGELAVKALPLDACTPKQKRRYVRLVRALAFLLFPATIFIGVANDRSQKDGNEKTELAIKNEGLTQAKLNEAEARAMRSDEAFQVFARSLDPSKLTVAQFAKYTQAQRALSQIVPGPSVVTALPASTESVVPGPNRLPLQQPQQVAAPQTRDSVVHDIEETQKKLNGLANGIHESITAQLSGVRATYIFGVGNQESKDAAFRNQKPRLIEILKQREDQLRQMVPEMDKERQSWIRLNSPSAADISADKAEFDKAMALSTQQVPLPDSWTAAGGLYQLGYGPMSIYLSALAARVSK